MARTTRIVEVAIAAALFVGCAGSVLAQDAAASAIANRQAAMKAVNTAAGQIRSANGDAAILRAAGKTINDNLKVFAANLPAGSGPESGKDTKAKAEIWSDAAGFKTALDSALAASDALAKAGDDPAALTAAAQGVFPRSCGGCHAKYRVNPPPAGAAPARPPG